MIGRKKSFEGTGKSNGGGGGRGGRKTNTGSTRNPRMRKGGK